jgi:hypothetical protein
MNIGVGRTANAAVLYGVPVTRSLAFAAPGPLCALGVRSLIARLPSLRVAPARFRIRGHGHVTAPRDNQETTVAVLQGDRPCGRLGASIHSPNFYERTIQESENRYPVRPAGRSRLASSPRCVYTGSYPHRHLTRQQGRPASSYLRRVRRGLRSMAVEVMRARGPFPQSFGSCRTGDALSGHKQIETDRRPERRSDRNHLIASSPLQSGQLRAGDVWSFSSFRFYVWILKSKDGVHATHVRKNERNANIAVVPPLSGSMRPLSLCSSFSASHISCDPGFVSPSLFIMDDKKKKTSAEAENAADGQTAAKGPVKIFKLDDVSASVFARLVPVRGEERTFYSVSFSRSYRDSGGSRKYVKTFNLEDLGKVVAVSQQSDEYIRQQPGVS